MEKIKVLFNIVAWVQILNLQRKFPGFLSGVIPLRHSDSNQPDVIKLDQLANSIPKLC